MIHQNRILSKQGDHASWRVRVGNLELCEEVSQGLGMSQVEQAHYFGMDCFRYVIDRLTYKGGLDQR